MSILTKFDISGIQEFIFSTNILREITGGSQIVEKVLSSDKESFFSHTIEKNGGELQYSGGGNAVVKFRNLEDAKKASRDLKLWLITHGRGLRLCTGYCEYDVNNEMTKAKEVFKALNESTDKEKRTQMAPRMMGSIAINKLDNLTHAPLCVYEDNPEQPMTAQQKNKLQEADGRCYERRINKEEITFVRELDEFKNNSRKPYIAVVHIDGNGMGQLVRSITEKGGIAEALNKKKKLSFQIKKAYENSFRCLVDYVIEKQGSIENKKNPEKPVVLIRPIILDGDDVTFICDGKYGLEYAEYFIKHINDIKDINDTNDTKGIALGDENRQTESIHLTACAGVAIVKPGFPFSRAYEIAEECCRFAKTEGRLRDNGEKRASWIDFHICKSGITSSLEDTRKQYEIAGKNGNTVSLCFRPWYIKREGDPVECKDLEIYNFESLKEITKELATLPDESRKSWARSKVKKLHSVMKAGSEAIEQEIAFLKSRYSVEHAGLLEKLGGSWDTEITLYDVSKRQTTKLFDALEIIDFCSWKEEQ